MAEQSSVEEEPPPQKSSGSEFSTFKAGSFDDFSYNDLPEFKRYSEPTLLEIFYDLFFAANYNIFVETQKITNHSRFSSYVGFFCLLWLTWFVVTLFDVRYATDSIFSRLTRAIQLGVLVGFVVVDPSFDALRQNANTFRVLSAILAISRACLVIEYGSTLWHVWGFPRARMPIFLQITVHATAAVIYLGVTFGFTSNRDSKNYIAWYVVAAVETVATLLLSNISPVLDLSDSHLVKRMTLLTVMILGDGIIQLAKDVVTIVENPDAWDPITIGLVTAAVATIYFIFLVFFDWMRSKLYLPPVRLQFWAVLHLAFHLALVLSLQSLTQWLIWSKVWAQLRNYGNVIDPDNDFVNVTSLDVSQMLNSSVNAFFRLHPKSVNEDGRETINNALEKIITIPDSFWPKTPNQTYWDMLKNSGNSTDWVTYKSSTEIIGTTLDNMLIKAFGIDVEEDVRQHETQLSDESNGGLFQIEVLDKTWSRCKLEFALGYASAGITIFLMAVLAVIARGTPIKTWPLIRLCIIILVAVGTALTSLLWSNNDASQRFLQSPWVLPTITFVWLFILIITHINGERVHRHAPRVRAIARIFRPRH
ncbi:hypothetical protein CP532_4151 [Ophiocordyceps camponoti-leonardi (nom. inval.)]|nr:hypothetical protein CP532_4151 [Ophiocordyceps camponoti-leonardi (nom. inval.)]